MSERETFLRRFHAARPGVTTRAFARGGSYELLAAALPASGCVLDLGCGDGPLLGRRDRTIGIDISREELGTTPRTVQGRAQALPFATGSFDACACHLAFMLFDELEAVVAELARVLVPGGRFLALLGGGPTATGDDAFHRFLALLPRHAQPLPSGDPRARSEAGWRELFAGWTEPVFTRYELDLGGSFDHVWTFVGASYELPALAAPELRAELRAAISELADPDGRIPLRVVTWLAQVTSPL